MYGLVYHPRVEKQLRHLPRKDQERVIKKIESLAQNPFQDLDIQKLANTAGGFRLRIGSIRVIYNLDQKVKKLMVIKVGFRGHIY